MVNRFVSAFAILCMAVITAAATSAGFHSRQLPVLPDSVITELGWSKVTLVKEPKCGEISTPLAFGCTNMETRNIEIRQTLGLPGQWQAIYHEKCHLMLFDHTVHFAQPEAEERLCDLIGNSRVQEMLAELGS